MNISILVKTGCEGLPKISSSSVYFLGRPAVLL